MAFAYHGLRWRNLRDLGLQKNRLGINLFGSLSGPRGIGSTHAGLLPDLEIQTPFARGYGVDFEAEKSGTNDVATTNIGGFQIGELVV